MKQKMNVKTFGDEPIKKSLHMKNFEEFVFGMAYGFINATFSSYFITSHMMPPNAEELAEVTNIISRRLPEVRKAIYFEE